MYYVISEEGSQILESYDSLPNPQGQADYFGCAVYIIRGEHTGLSASPRVENSTSKIKTPKETICVTADYRCDDFIITVLNKEE